MSAKARKIPSYRLHKPTGQAVVRLDGRDHYLGRHGTEASQEAYRRTVATWLVTNRPRPIATAGSASSPTPTINEIILAFWTRHAEMHYRRVNGTPTGELANYRDSLRPLRQLFGHTLAQEFSPLGLKAVRRLMIDSGLARGTINQRIGRIVRLFKWASSEELVPAEVYLALKTVTGLPKGRTDAKETEPVQPVADDAVEAIRPHVARQVWAMIQLQRLTGMRPGEVTILRTCDLDTSGDVWVFNPSGHKTAHHDRERKIYLGPRAQEVVKPWLRSKPEEYLFQPKEAMEEYRANQRLNRKTPLYPSQRLRTRKIAPKYAPGEHYSTRTYYHAVKYGCRRAGVAFWHPNRLRHSVGTAIRTLFGLEAAQVILGHAQMNTSEIYAEKDENLARRVAAEVG